MKNRILLVTASIFVLGSSAAFAQSSDVPDHPRVNEVNQRLDNQQQRIDSGVQNGTLNAKQATNDEKRDAKVANELSNDEAKHNGHVTKAEQKKMNKQLNKNSHKIKKQETKNTTPVTPAQ